MMIWVDWLGVFDGKDEPGYGLGPDKPVATLDYALAMVDTQDTGPRDVVVIIGKDVVVVIGETEKKVIA